MLHTNMLCKTMLRQSVCFVLILHGLLPTHHVQANWNNPYTQEQSDEKVLYSSFSARPKHFDPIRSYGQDEYVFIRQIYESPLQYHFLHRPFKLVPRLLTEMPIIVHRNDQGNVINDTTQDIATTEYILKFKRGIHYQPHPAFAKNNDGEYLYHSLSTTEAESYHTINEFKQTGSREFTAADLVYQIKRFANPKLHSPLDSLMQEYIVGMKELATSMQAAIEKDSNVIINPNDFQLTGVSVDNDYQLTIRIKGVYPQFIYWLAMPFFAPMPWEADAFYGQDGMQKNNLNLNWYPIGTGPYMLTENNPNLRMVLERNPNFRDEFYPTEGEPSDSQNGMLDDAGKKLPFIDKVIYSLEKESLPSWTKFLQGYYDRSGISSDSFDQVVNFQGNDVTLSDDMIKKGITLTTETEPIIYYIGFNMLDSVVGGDSQRAKLLRQAISIALDYEEYVEIFRNGRGVVPQTIIPPGIFGHIDGEQGVNPITHQWINGKAQRRPIEDAKKLLAEAGYANGIDQQTQKPLTLYYDDIDRGASGKAQLNWMRKQFNKLNIQLVIRSTDYNRFQEKTKNGEVQIFSWGWGADYPDPENFLFLHYGPNGKVEHGGPNYTNFSNAEFDQLFEKMKNMPNTPERLAIVQQQVELLREQAVWAYMFFPKQYVLSHAWYKNGKPNMITDGTLKYRQVDPELRAASRQEWNKPKLWPLLLVVLLLLIICIPAYLAYRRSERYVEIT